MKKLLIGITVVALCLLAGCDSSQTTRDTPEMTAESNQPEVNPQPTYEEIVLEENDNEVAPQIVSPNEIPSIRETFRLPFTIDEEDVTVYVQKMGSDEALILSPYQTMITLETIKLTDPLLSMSWTWLEEEPSGAEAVIVIKSGENVYETSFYYEQNVLSSSIDGPGGIGYLYAFDMRLAQIFNELFE